MNIDPKELDRVAFEFAEEIHGGRWDHLGLKTKALSECYPSLVRELRSRCPGLDYERYAAALAQALHDSR